MPLFFAISFNSLVINLTYLTSLLALSHAKFNSVVSNKHGLKYILSTKCTYIIFS